MKIGVLALQGDVREHLAILERLEVAAVPVKRTDELDAVDGLILPGGESTTIGKLLDRFGLMDRLKEKVGAGLPVFGTCAGLILMAREVLGEQDAPDRLGLMDIGLRRNAYGRQTESFEADIDGLRAAFIRAPIIEQVGSSVEVLASFDGHPVLVREGSMLGCTFHPEVMGEDRVHARFLGMIAGTQPGR